MMSLERVDRVHRITIVFCEKSGTLRGASQESYTGVLDTVTDQVIGAQIGHPEPLTADSLVSLLDHASAEALVAHAAVVAERDQAIQQSHDLEQQLSAATAATAAVAEERDRALARVADLEAHIVAYSLSVSHAAESAAEY